MRNTQSRHMSTLRKAFSLLCSLLLLISLSACRREDAADLSARLRDFYAAKPALSLTVDIRTDFGDRVVDFTLSYERGAEESATLRVLSPESIRGVTAYIEGENTVLRYEDVTLELGALPGTGYSPMETLPFMLRQWSQGYASQTGFERIGDRQAFLVVYRSTQSGVVLEQKALFDPETFVPLRCELSADGVGLVFCDFSSHSEQE